MAKDSKKGRCHLCCERRALTEEHMPPQSAGNNSWSYAHTIEGMRIGGDQQIPPPPLEGRNGIKKRSLCKQCNWFTAEQYNAAFKDWTNQAAEVIPNIGERETVTVTFREIKPLAILKQIATMALATADISPAPALARLRRFVLYSFEPELPPEFCIRTYLNPPRVGEDTDKLLTTKRLSSTHTLLDVVDGSALFCFAEISNNPLGYLIHFNERSRALSKQAAELTDISFFAKYRWGEKADISLNLPVRNPFGPVGGYYVKLKGPGTWTSGAQQCREAV